ncbi:SPOR domain-containing protein [Roseovarius phycicola]
MTVQPGAVSERQLNLQTIANFAGAAISLALVVGIGVWGYKLLIRDVSGVPVIKAAEGPLRVQPQDPGGTEFQHQGLAVNDVAAVGTAADPADRLVLAPEPLELSLEDTPQVATVANEVAKQAAAAQEANVSEPVTQTEAETEVAALEVVDRLAQGVEPLGELQPAPEVEALPQTETVITTEDVAEETPVTEGLGRSLRPQLRPTRVAASTDSVAEAVAASVATASANSTSALVEVSAIPAGTRLAQLGAYESAEVAAQEWTRLSGQFSEYLGDKQQVIQRAQSGGRTFYRLRAMGFADLNDARRFCSALVAENAECIPVVTR